MRRCWRGRSIAASTKCVSARNVYAHVPRSVVRIAFPLFAARAARTSHRSRGAAMPARRSSSTSRLPLLIALAIIRILVYGLRRVFPSQAWLPASEVAIGTTIWGLAILYFLGVLPEMAAAARRGRASRSASRRYRC